MADNPYAKYANPYAGYVPVGVPDPTKPLDLKSKQLGVQKGEAELALTPYQLQKQKADAAKAEIDLKNAQDQYNAQHPPVNETGLFGPDYLKTLSHSDQNMVKALAEGRLAFPQGSALRAPFWQEKLSQVAQYDPTFDATNYNTRAQARVNAVKGKLGSSSNALNTAIGHLGQLSDQISGTASHNFTPFNALENSVAKTFGDPGVTNFQDTAAKLADELEAVYRNGGGAEQGVTRQLRSLDPNMSLAQKQGIVQNAMDLLASKMAANLSQYNFGTGGKPTWDMLDPHALQVLHDKAPDLLTKYFAPPPGSNGAPPAGPPSIGGDGPPAPGSPPRADYSAMVGGPQQNLATGPTRNAFDPVMAGAVSTFIRKGVPYDTAAAYVQSHGAVLDPNQYNSALAYQKQHPSATPNVNADKTVPTTMGERLASSPLAAGIVGAGTAGTAGLSDVAGRALFGPQWDANRQALSLTNPGSDLAGNVAGGVGGMLAGSAALGKIAPGLVNAARASRIAPFLPAASDAAYGATYGASESPDNPLGGAVAGGLTGIGGGMFARGATKALGRTIAPTAGAAAPLYDAGVFPTVGQRAAAMTGPIGSRVGKAVNTVEQAMQSVPVLGALPAMAREGARKDFQTGAFNQSLGEIGQQLPKGAGPGPEAHAYASGAFTRAYDAARSGMQFVPDPQFAADNAAFAAKLNDGTLNAEQVKQVQQRINTAVDSRLGKSPVLGGDAYKNAASELADTQRAWAKADPLKAQALGDYLSIFDGAARRNSNPLAVQMLDQADRGYAQLVRIQQASARGGAGKDAGSFSPVDYAGAVKQMAGGVRSNAYSRGNALGQDYAQAGLSLRDTLPNSGTAERLMTGQVVGGAGLGGITALGGGHLIANPVTAGMFGAYLPGIQNLVKKAIAPREYTLPPDLAAILNGAGNGIYDRSGAIGRFGAPAALGYFAGQ